MTSESEETLENFQWSHFLLSIVVWGVFLYWLQYLSIFSYSTALYNNGYH